MLLASVYGIWSGLVIHLASPLISPFVNPENSVFQGNGRNANSNGP